MKLSPQKRLDRLKERRDKANREIATVNKELAELARELCPYNRDDIVEDKGIRYKVCYAEPISTIWGHSFKLPGYQLRCYRLKRDGVNCRERQAVCVTDTLKKVTPGAPKPPRPVSKTQRALDAALALLPATKAAQVRKEHGV